MDYVHIGGPYFVNVYEKVTVNGFAFSFSSQFARESAMLKLPEERRRRGESKGAGARGGGGG